MKKNLKYLWLLVPLLIVGCEAAGWKPDVTKEPITWTETLTGIAKDGIWPTILVMAYKVYSNLTFKGRVEKTLEQITPVVLTGTNKKDN